MLAWAAIVGPAAAVMAAEKAGEVLVVRGDCQRDGDGRSQGLKVGDAVDVHDTVTVPADGKLKLRMIDGSVLSLTGGTRLTIDGYGLDPAAGTRDARLSLAGGLLRSVVSHMAAPSRFEIGTATAVAAVRSTDWFAEVWPDGSSRVGVLEGTVALAARSSGVSVDVVKGYGALVKPGLDPTTPKPWPAAEFHEYLARTAIP
jgi:hypothetical protein